MGEYGEQIEGARAKGIRGSGRIAAYVEATVASRGRRRTVPAEQVPACGLVDKPHRPLEYSSSTRLRLCGGMEQDG